MEIGDIDITHLPYRQNRTIKSLKTDVDPKITSLETMLYTGSSVNYIGGQKIIDKHHHSSLVDDKKAQKIVESAHYRFVTEGVVLNFRYAAIFPNACHTRDADEAARLVNIPQTISIRKRLREPQCRLVQP